LENVMPGLTKTHNHVASESRGAKELDDANADAPKESGKEQQEINHKNGYDSLLSPGWDTRSIRIRDAASMKSNVRHGPISSLSLLW
jgi:hypothetical protein